MAGFNSELIHKTRNACCSKIIKKTKENNKNCLGSQIETFEIRIGNWLELTHCVGKGAMSIQNRFLSPDKVAPLSQVSETNEGQDCHGSLLLWLQRHLDVEFPCQ